MTTAQRLQNFSMPDVGEGLTEAEVLDWRVAVGDMVSVNQVIVEIETAKAAVELPSPYSGRVHALLVEPGVTVTVGTPIITVDTDPDAGELPVDGISAGAAPERPASQAVPAQGNGAAAPVGRGGTDAGTDVGTDAGTEIGTEAGTEIGTEAGTAVGTDVGAKIGEVTADGRIATLVGYVPAGGSATRRPRRAAGPPAAAPLAAAPAAPPAPAPQAPAAASSAPAGSVHPAGSAEGAHTPLATPPVRKLAKELGIDLATVTATRADGVISRADIEALAGGDRHAATAVESPAYDPATRERRIPVKGVRKRTAAAMVQSAFTAPHVTEFLTVDVTPMMELRDRLKRRPEFADVKLTPLTFAARAVCLAARRTPELNAVLDEAAGEIVVKQYVNLGIAAATPRGLIVPVVHDADALDLAGLATALTELTATARAGRTTPAQMSGGTFTITNVGVFGVDTGTPIINPGESAILALGSIKDAPWVVDGQLAVRKVCQLAMSFDHRVVDGQQGSEFLADVGALLADPGLALAF